MVKVLCIDDDESFTRVLQNNLTRRGGYDVCLARTGDEGVNLARSLNPDIILLDLFMPGLCGGEVALNLRQDPVTEKIPVVFMSGQLAPGDSSTNEGTFASYPTLSKPASIDDVIGSIEKHRRK